MFLESIGYTATLIEYVARLTRRSVSEVTTTIGFRRVFDLCHNAPMNRLLPIDRIAMEVISDNYLSAVSWSDGMTVDQEYGKQIAESVGVATQDKHKYVDELYNLLIGSDCNQNVF